MDQVLKQHELSVWEDKIGSEYFEEEKIAVIGGDELDTPLQAYDITLKENINGEKTLTFSLPRKYLDKEGELKDNPFLSLLSAEKKVKFRDGAPYKTEGNTSEEIIASLEEEDFDNRWIDFLIKKIEEDKATYVNKYTCKQLHTTELGKNGYSVTLHADLDNNHGNLKTLANRILEGSDWQFDDSSDFLVEYRTEPLFYAQIPDGKEVALNQLTGFTEYGGKDQAVNGPGYLYFFYSDLEKQGTAWKLKDSLVNIQVLYADHLFTQEDATEEHVIVNDNYQMTYEVARSIVADLSIYMMGQPELGQAIPSTEAYSAKKVVPGSIQFYEPVGDKFVSELKNENGNVIYKHTSTEYLSVDSVQDYIVNSRGFIADTGWTWVGHEEESLECISWPTNFNESLTNTSNKNYLMLPNAGDRLKSYVFTNDSLDANNETVNEGDIFQCRVRAKILWKPGGGDEWALAGTTATDNGFYVYLQNGKNEGISDKQFITLPNGSGNGAVDENGESYWLVSEVITANKTTSLTDKVKVCLEVHGFESQTSQIAIEAIEFYRYIECERVTYSGTHLVPGAYSINSSTIDQGENIKPTEIPDSKVHETYEYYKVDTTLGYTQKVPPEDIEGYREQLRPENEAYRTIEVKQSNYFNNLSSLAELYEMWVNYSVKHQKNGKIFLEEGKPIKTVRFSSLAPGKENYAGFKYGINLKSLKRTIDSEKIVSKLIVKPNNNEFAEDGVCSIATASENSLADNLIYNFNYYVNQGLLNQNQVLRDLYGLSEGDLAYLPLMSSYNKAILELNNKIVAQEGSLQYLEEMKQYCNSKQEAAREELKEAEEDYNWAKKVYKSTSDERVKSRRIAYNMILAQQRDAEAEYKLYEYNLELLKGKYQGKKWEEGTEYYQDELVYKIEDDYYKWYRVNDKKVLVLIAQYKKDDKKINWDTIAYEDGHGLPDLPLSIQRDYYDDQRVKLNAQFYVKYSRFIQEGTWTDEKYVDSSLYYCDAKKVSDQNSFPKVSYTISVVETSAAEGFDGYNFGIGDKTYIEDPEFFGYNYVTLPGTNEAHKTPYRKEAVVSEKSRNFSDPSKSTITVKTYKNQFEELFSKISATTTSLQYASGGYDRAANVVLPSGEIAMSSLEAAFANNAFILGSSKNQVISWNSGFGLEAKDASNPNSQVRLTSYGFMMTTDGGETWINGITGAGINTHMLTAGAISADKIIIRGGRNNPAFAWTDVGLDAIRGPEAFVRYNQYGLFGTDKGPDIEEALKTATTFDESVDVISQMANFALTWKGLNLNAQDGSTSLTPLGGLEIFNPNWTFDNDIIHYEYNLKPYVNENDIYQPGEKIPLISIGRFRGSNFTDIADRKAIEYGMRLRNQKGHVTLQTDIDGNLWLRNVLQIGEKPVESHEILFSPVPATLGQDLNVVLNNSAVSLGISDFYKQEKTENNDTKVYAYLTDDSYDNLSKWEELAKSDNSGLSKYSVQFYYQGAEGEKIFFKVNSWYFTEGNSKQLEIIVSADSGIPSEIKILGAQLVKTSGFFLELTGAPAIYDEDSDGSRDGVILRAGIGIDNQLSNTPFYVTGKGKMVANNAKIRGTIEATDGYFDGEMAVRNEKGDLVAGIGRIGNDPATIFWAGAKEHPVFSVNERGYLQTYDAHVSGTLSTVHFEKNTSAILGGSFIIAPSYYSQKGYSNGEFLNEDDRSAVADWPFVNGEAKFEVVRSEMGKEEKGIQGTLLVVNSDDRTKVQVNLPEGEQIREGDLIKVTNANHHIIQMEALAKNRESGQVLGPRISMTYENEDSLVIGALGGTVTSSFGTLADSEYGVYMKDAYIEGKIALPNAGITNEETSGDPVRFWAGAKYGERDGAPFRVTQSGYLYASNANIQGSVILPKAGITDSGDSEESIRLWAGAEYDNRENAPFRVSQSGSLYASDASIEGSVILPEAGITSYVDPENSNPIRFWAGTEYDNREKAPFRVSQNGFLVADGGFSFGNNAISYDGTENGTVYLSNVTLKWGEGENEKKSLKDYIDSKETEIDENVLKKYLGSITESEISERYVISPFIGGGYLSITKEEGCSITIDPLDGTPFEITNNEGTAVMSVNSEGGAYFSGKISAKDGFIGGWEITPTEIRYYPSDGPWAFVNPTGHSLQTNAAGGSKNLVIGIGPKTGMNFGVDTTGHLYATDATISGKIDANEGTISGWTFNGSRFYHYKSNDGSGIAFNPAAVGSTSRVFKVGTFTNVPTASGSWGDETGFMIYGDGSIISTKGKIGGWNIDTNFLGTYGAADKTTFISYVGKSAYINVLDASKSCSFYAKGQFAVTTEGVVYASELYAKGGELGGWSIKNDSIYGDSYDGEITRTVTLKPDYVRAKTPNGQPFDATWYGIINVANQNISDATLKHSIDSFSSVYDDIFDELKPKVYCFREEAHTGSSTLKHMGFIAQEVSEVFQLNKIEDHGLVYKEGKYYRLAYPEFIALNTWQIQKAKARITELETQVASLAERLSNLENS